MDKEILKASCNLCHLCLCEYLYKDIDEPLVVEADLARRLARHWLHKHKTKDFAIYMRRVDYEYATYIIIDKETPSIHLHQRLTLVAKTETN